MIIACLFAVTANAQPATPKGCWQIQIGTDLYFSLYIDSGNTRLFKASMSPWHNEPEARVLGIFENNSVEFYRIDPKLSGQGIQKYVGTFTTSQSVNGKYSHRGNTGRWTAFRTNTPSWDVHVAGSYHFNLLFDSKDTQLFKATMTPWNGQPEALVLGFSETNNEFVFYRIDFKLTRGVQKYVGRFNGNDRLSGEYTHGSNTGEWTAVRTTIASCEARASSS